MAMKKKSKVKPEASAAPAETVAPVVDRESKVEAARQKIEDAIAAGAGAGEPAAPPVVEEPPTPEEQPVEAVQEPTPQTTAVVPAQAAAVPAVGMPGAGSLQLIFEPMQDVMIAPWGVFPTVKWENGEANDGDLSYGRHIDVEVMSWNNLYIASPGSDAEEAKQHVRYSYDGKTIDFDGSDLKEYVAALKLDWPNAAIKHYKQVVGVLVGCDSPAGQATAGNFVQIQLAPSSHPKFYGHDMSTSLRVARGLLPAEGCTIVRFTAKPESRNGKAWTSAIPSTPPVA